jgi:hypothetical protein
LGLLSIRAVDSLPGTGRTTLITVGERFPHGDLIGLLIYRHVGHVNPRYLIGSGSALLAPSLSRRSIGK